MSERANKTCDIASGDYEATWSLVCIAQEIQYACIGANEVLLTERAHDVLDDCRGAGGSRNF